MILMPVKSDKFLQRLRSRKFFNAFQVSQEKPRRFVHTGCGTLHPVWRAWSVNIKQATNCSWIITK